MTINKVEWCVNEYVMFERLNLFFYISSIVQRSTYSVHFYSLDEQGHNIYWLILFFSLDVVRNLIKFFFIHFKLRFKILLTYNSTSYQHSRRVDTRKRGESRVLGGQLQEQHWGEGMHRACGRFLRCFQEMSYVYTQIK